jgi:heme A synthase
MLRRFAWATLVFNLIVILLGANVRATGSGAGCGASWPTCEGRLIPSDASVATWTEFTHRAASGVALVAVFVLAAWVFRSFDKGSLVRSAAVWSIGAILSEAAIGAAIVLFEWVANDSSVARLLAVPLHLVNTFVLLAALTVTAWWVDHSPAARPAVPRPLWWAGLGLLLVAATGSVTALADTLSPAASFSDGLAQDFSSAGTFLTQVRVLHPVVATLVGAYVAFLGLTRARPGHQQTIGLVIAAIVGTQVFAGIANVLLLTPLWVQIFHLALADCLWIMFVLFVVDESPDRESALV